MDGKSNTLESSEHLYLTQMSYFFPVWGVMGLLFGAVFVIAELGVFISDNIQNAIFFGPLLVFAYSNFMIKGIESNQQSVVHLRPRLNSIVELSLFAFLYGVFCFVTWLRSVQ